MTFRSVGADNLDALICRTLDNTVAAAADIRVRANLKLAAEPSLSTVLFRYLSPQGEKRSDEITLRVRAELFRKGIAALATTVLNGRVHFKLTLLNPNSTPKSLAVFWTRFKTWRAKWRTIMHAHKAATLALRSLLNCVVREYADRSVWSQEAAKQN